MRARSILSVFAILLTSSLYACSSSNSCIDPQPAGSSVHLLGGSAPLGDAGATDAADDAWKEDCAKLNCGPGGTCGPEQTSSGAIKAVCYETC